MINISSVQAGTVQTSSQAERKAWRFVNSLETHPLLQIEIDTVMYRL